MPACGIWLSLEGTQLSPAIAWLHSRTIAPDSTHPNDGYVGAMVLRTHCLGRSSWPIMSQWATGSICPCQLRLSTNKWIGMANLSLHAGTREVPRLHTMISRPLSLAGCETEHCWSVLPNHGCPRTCIWILPDWNLQGRHTSPVD